MSVYSDNFRVDFAKSDKKRDEGRTTPAGVVRFDNIAYDDKDKKWQVLDVYRPRNKEGEKLPVIFIVHGGGWVYGDKNVYQFYGMDLALRGFAVVNFSYRLAPENKYPAQLEDINLVASWIMAHQEEYDFDAEHVFAVGDSAGAHLLSLYAAFCTSDEYARKYPFTKPAGFQLSAIGLNCGIYEFGKAISDEREQTLMGDLLPLGGTDEEYELITVTNHITENYPPTSIVTSSFDFLNKNALPLAAALTVKKVPFTYNLYGSSTHKLWHVFHCDIDKEDAIRCNDEQCEFFRKCMK